MSYLLRHIFAPVLANDLGTIRGWWVRGLLVATELGGNRPPPKDNPPWCWGLICKGEGVNWRRSFPGDIDSNSKTCVNIQKVMNYKIYNTISLYY